jgi:hypothetical protein
VTTQTAKSPLIGSAPGIEMARRGVVQDQHVALDQRLVALATIATVEAREAAAATG